MLYNIYTESHVHSLDSWDRFKRERLWSSRMSMMQRSGLNARAMKRPRETEIPAAGKCLKAFGVHLRRVGKAGGMKSINAKKGIKPAPINC